MPETLAQEELEQCLEGLVGVPADEFVVPPEPASAELE